MSGASEKSNRRTTQYLHPSGAIPEPPDPNRRNDDEHLTDEGKAARYLARAGNWITATVLLLAALATSMSVDLEPDLDDNGITPKGKTPITPPTTTSTPSPTSTPTFTATPTSTYTPSPTSTPTNTPSPTSTSTRTPSPTSAPTYRPSSPMLRINQRRIAY